MEVFVVLYRNKEHSGTHHEKSHVLGVFDSEQNAESAVETLVNNGIDFRRISTVPFNMNQIYRY